MKASLRLNEANRQPTVAEINATKETIEFSPITVDGLVFDADQKSVMRMILVLQTMPANGMVNWVLADNTEADITKAQLTAVVNAIGARTRALNTYARSLKTDIQSLKRGDIDPSVWPK